MFAFAALAAIVSATPASAAAADDKGFFIYLDLANTQPSSLNQDFAIHTETTATPPITERLTIDNDADLTYKVGFGYTFGDGNGSLRVSYWSFDNDDEQSGSVVGGLYPTIFGYGYGGGGMYLYSSTGVSYVATSSVEATTIDVDYVREIVGSNKASLHWLAGLRVANYEEDQGFEGHDGLSDYFQDKHIESDGFGLRVGAAAEFKFTEHFGLKSSLIFSFLQADTEAQTTQTLAAGAPIDDLSIASDDNVKGEMRDFDVKAVWDYGGVSFWIGYEASEWDGMVVDPTVETPFIFGGTSPRDRDSIAFNSLHAGVGFKFGGGK